MAEPTTPPVTTPQDAAVIQQATTGTTPAAPQEFSYTMADGQTFKGATPEEVMKAVGQRYDHLYGHTKTVESENAQYRETIKTLPGQQPQGDGFDQVKYWDMLVKDPLGAQRYAIQFLPEYQKLAQQTEQQQWQNNAAQFRSANPDFAVNDENITKLNTLCQKLYPEATVLTADQMTAAHAMAVRAKLYEVQPVEAKTPPPLAPQGGNNNQPDKPDINKMDQEQLRAHIESLAAKERAQ